MADPKESQDDKDVDQLIADVQSALDKLKAAQRKDVADEDSDDDASEPKNLKQAEQKAYRTVRSARRTQDSGKPE